MEDPGSQVFVALYDVSREDERVLKGWESDAYRKLHVRVQTLEGEQLAWVYVLDAYEGGLPSASYLGRDQRGGRGRGRPRRLRRRPAQPAVPVDRRLSRMGPEATRGTDPVARPRPPACSPTGRASTEHDVALVIGSGWSPAADLLGDDPRGGALRRTCPASAHPRSPATPAPCDPWTAAASGPWCSSAAPISTRVTASPPSCTACGRLPRPAAGPSS